MINKLLEFVLVVFIIIMLVLFFGFLIQGVGALVHSDGRLACVGAQEAEYYRHTNVQGVVEVYVSSVSEWVPYRVSELNDRNCTLLPK